MRVYVAAALAVGLLMAGHSARAQSLNDIGRQLQNQLLPQQQPDRDRERSAYEQGRRDQEEALRRERDQRRGGYDDRRRVDSRDRDEQAQRYRADRERQEREADAQRNRGRY